MSEARLSVLISAKNEASPAIQSFTAELANLGKIAAGFTLGNLGAQLTQDLGQQLRSVLDETQKFGEEVYKLQGLIGGSAQSVSSLISAFETLGGVGADAAGGALTRFERGLRGQVDITETGAESGKTFAGVLSELGVQAVDTTGHFRPMTEVLNDVMDAEKRLSAEGRAGADAMVLFGRGAGLQLAPMLLLGSQAFKEARKTAAELGVQLTGANVRAIHDFTVNQRQLNESLTGLKLTLGAALMGPLAELAHGITDLAIRFNKELVPGIKAAETEYGIWQKLIGGDKTPDKPGEAFDPLGMRTGAWNLIKAGSDPFGIRTALFNATPLAQVHNEIAAGPAQMQSTFGQDARQAREDAIATQLTQTRAERERALNQQELAGKRLLEIVTHDINVAQRENLDLVKSEAAAQLELIPLKQQQGALALELLRTEDQRASIERQAAVDRARLTSLPSSRALEDSQYRQQLIQAQIRAGVMGGTGIPSGAIPDLIALKRGQAALELGALQGGRGVTLASREAETGQLQTGIATAPLREAQADLQLSMAQQQLAVDSLHAQIEVDRLAASEKIADLERGRRVAEDKLFVIGQLKSELAPAIQPQFTINMNVNSAGQPDMEAIKTSLIDFIFGALIKTAANTGAPAPSTVPGAAY